MVSCRAKPGTQGRQLTRAQKLAFFTAVAAVLALGALAAPAGKGPDMSDAGIYTIAHLSSFGKSDAGVGPRLADCIVTSADYDAFYADVGDRFAGARRVSLVSYTSSDTIRSLVLAPGADEPKAAQLFVEACRAHHGAPHRYF